MGVSAQGGGTFVWFSAPKVGECVSVLERLLVCGGMKRPGREGLRERQGQSVAFK